jgi:membrane associated rhomboid family serine protease
MAYDDISYKIKNGGAYIQLITINAIVFTIINLVALGLFLFNKTPALPYDFVNTFAVPCTFWNMIHQPWSLFTYMFVQYDIWHLFFNMLMLYFAGELMQSTLGSFRVWANYIIGGVCGALLMILFFDVFPVFQGIKYSAYTNGASASVLAILVIATVYYPTVSIRVILFDVQLKYLTLILIFIDIISIDNGNAGGHIAHLGGAMWGLIYGRTLKNGYDLTAWLSSLSTAYDRKFTKSQLKVVHSPRIQHEQEKVTKQAASKQQSMDDLLDKISKTGYDSLTQDERDTLYKLSQDK